MESDLKFQNNNYITPSLHNMLYVGFLFVTNLNESTVKREHVFTFDGIFHQVNVF